MPTNLIIISIKTENDTTTYWGTATVTMKDGPISNVPTEIKIIRNNVISIWFDPTKVKMHFGESPIYGIVLTKKDMEMTQQKQNMTM